MANGLNLNYQDLKSQIIGQALAVVQKRTKSLNGTSGASAGSHN